MFSEIRITKKQTSDVLVSVDTYFDSMYKEISLGDDEFDAIETIDGATPYILDGKRTQVFHSRYGDDISLKEMSSGVKSILLVMHRLKSDKASYTPSFNSMGANAKSYILHYLNEWIKSEHSLPCMFYCVDGSLPLQDYKFQCCDDEGNQGYFITIVTGEEV